MKLNKGNYLQRIAALCDSEPNAFIHPPSFVFGHYAGHNIQLRIHAHNLCGEGLLLLTWFEQLVAPSHLVSVRFVKCFNDMTLILGNGGESRAFEDQSSTYISNNADLCCGWFAQPAVSSGIAELIRDFGLYDMGRKAHEKDFCITVRDKPASIQEPERLLKIAATLASSYHALAPE